MMLAMITVLALGPGADPKAEDRVERIALRLAKIAGDPTALPVTREEAVRMLQRMGPEARAAVPDLVDQLGKPQDPILLEMIINTLAQVGPPARSSLPAMTRVVGLDLDVDRAVRRATERMLASEESLEIEDLQRQTRSVDASMRLRSAKALASKGRAGEPAVSDLLHLLHDADADVRRAAMAALRAVTPEINRTEAFLQSFLLDLRDQDESVRLAAVRNIGRLGPAAASVASALQRAQSDAAPDIARAAAEALARVTGQ
jgi:HEAT repeat protein